MTPSFIRLVADTDDSPLGNVALEYAKSLLRIAPLRVLGAGAVPSFMGAWARYARLMTTPTNGAYVNVVATSASRWSWNMVVKAPRADQTIETISQRLELWTAGVRNVLLALEMPKDEHQLQSALKYDAIVVPRRDLSIYWSHKGRTVSVIETPVDPTRGHQTLRCAVVGY